MPTKFNINGFSLMELLVVIGLISIILALAVTDFKSWQKKYYIENQAREMMTDLSELRLKAIQTESNHVAVLSASPTMMTFRSYSSEEPVTLSTGKQVFSKYFQYPISNKPTSFDRCGDIGITARGNTRDFQVGGTFNSNQTIYILPTGTGAAVDCLVISDARINLGKYNGTNCSFQ